jgi:hypothetical protein
MLSAAKAHAVSASISTPVDSMAITLEDTFDAAVAFNEFDVHVAQVQRVAQRNDLGRSLGGEDARDARGVLDVETVVATLDGGQLRVGDDHALRPGLAQGASFGRDVDHSQFAGPVDVAKGAIHGRLGVATPTRGARRPAPTPPRPVPRTPRPLIIEPWSTLTPWSIQTMPARHSRTFR